MSVGQSNDPLYEARFEVRVVFEEANWPSDRSKEDETCRAFLSYFDGVHEGSPLHQLYEAGHEGVVGISGRLTSLKRLEARELT